MTLVTRWVFLLLAAGMGSAAGPAAAQNPLPRSEAGIAPAQTTAEVAAGYEQQFEMARRLAIAGRREEAIAAYTALLARSPGNADVLLGRGRTYAWMGRWPEAEADLQAATRQTPAYADAWSALGDMYLWSDRPQLAAAAYGEWLALRPDDPAPLLARGRARRAAGDLVGAGADFDAAGARGGDIAQVQAAKVSLLPRANNPEAVVPAGYRWSSRVDAGWTGFSPARDGWRNYGVSLRRHFERGSLAAEWLGAQRFGRRDHAWALDGYVDLWARAYANVRYQQGSRSGLFPERAWRVEVFQGVGDGWELSGSHDRLDFTNSSVDMYGLGIGRYTGNYYLRLRSLYVPGSGSLSHRGLVRYYYAGNGDDYLEFNAGSGRSSEAAFGPSGGSIRNRSSSAGVTFVRFLNPRWGFKLAAAYGDGDDGFTERDVSVALYTRW